MSGLYHNPAASYDFGTEMWSLGEPWDAYPKYATPELSYDDPETVRFGWDHIEAAFEKHCDENPPVEYQLEQPVFGDVDSAAQPP